MIYVTEGFARQFRIFGFGFRVSGLWSGKTAGKPCLKTPNQKPEAVDSELPGKGA
jgi:hypothetical protein